MKDKKIIKYGSIIFLLLNLIILIKFRFEKNYSLITYEKSYNLLIQLKNIDFLNYNFIFIYFLLFFFCITLIYFIFCYKKDLIFPLGLFIISPTFIFYIINPNIELFSFFMFLLCLLLIFKKHYFFSILICSLIGFFNSIHAVIISFLFLSLSGKPYEKSQKSYLKYCFATSLFSAVLFSIFNKTNFLMNRNILSTIFSFVLEIGSFYGVAFIFILISIFGVLTFWVRKSLYEIFLLMALIFSILYGNIFFFSLSVFLLSGKFIDFFIYLSWQVKQFKFITFFFIFLMLFLSQFIFWIGYVNESPTSNEIGLYQKLNNLDESIVLNYYKNGYALEYYTNHNSFSKYDAFENIRVSELIYYSSSLDRTKELLDENKIKYIIISESMKYEVWQEEVKGLLIMITDKDTFKLIYDLEEYQIYEYLLFTP